MGKEDGRRGPGVDSIRHHKDCGGHVYKSNTGYHCTGCGMCGDLQFDYEPVGSWNRAKHIQWSPSYCNRFDMFLNRRGNTCALCKYGDNCNDRRQTVGTSLLQSEDQE